MNLLRQGFQKLSSDRHTPSKLVTMPLYLFIYFIIILFYYRDRTRSTNIKI